MKVLLVGLTVASITGCAAYRPIDGSPSEVHRLIATHALLQPGDRVRITTVDGTARAFMVTAIDGGAVIGKDASVDIEQIRSVEKEPASGGKPIDVVAAVYLVELAVLVASHQATMHSQCEPGHGLCRHRKTPFVHSKPLNSVLRGGDQAGAPITARLSLDHLPGER